MRKLLLATCAALMIVSPALASDERRAVLMCESENAEEAARYAAVQVFPDQKIALIATVRTEAELSVTGMSPVSHHLDRVIFGMTLTTDAFGVQRTVTTFQRAAWRGGMVDVTLSYPWPQLVIDHSSYQCLIIRNDYLSAAS
jgi:hypothetical protein